MDVLSRFGVDECFSEKNSLSKEMSQMSESVFTYWVDSKDIIIKVSSNWKRFARDNEWNSPINPESVVGHVWWMFIGDGKLRDLYRELFNKVRQGGYFEPIPYRCDAPHERRFFELVFNRLPNNHIEITNKVVRLEPRPLVRLLDDAAERSHETLKLCSVCKQIALSENHWVEVEEAAVQLRLFEANKLPQLVEGLCPDCYQKFLNQLRDMKLG